MPKLWFFICRNLALDKTKRASNQDASLDNEGHDAPDHSYSANPEEQAVQRDRVERVRRLMDLLPDHSIHWNICGIGTEFCRRQGNDPRQG